MILTMLFKLGTYKFENFLSQIGPQENC